MVWKATKQVGFGYSGNYVVANYYPSGNIDMKYLENVFPAWLFNRKELSYLFRIFIFWFIVQKIIIITLSLLGLFYHYVEDIFISGL